MLSHTTTLSYRYLLRWLREAGVAPPVIISGGTISLQQQLIQQLAQVGFCYQRGEEACTECPGCRQAQSGVHPDFINLTTDKKTWTIKIIRSLTKKLAITPVGERRLVVIQEIEKVSSPAAAVLLKLLEESRPSTRILMTTKWPRRLLSTIISRSQHVRLPLEKPAVSQDETVFLAEDLSEYLRRAARLEADTLAKITAALAQQLDKNGPTPQLRRAITRLRDYYLITSQRGNDKLAQEVLLLSLPDNNGIS
ncbi:MAG: hypothetical protein WEA04_05125 [Candidatus Andersenbacteria bacterium]